MAGTTGLALIDRELVIGDAIGEFPMTRQVPLRDGPQQRKVRLKPGDADRRTDVRATNGRSVGAAHRLRALGVSWARWRGPRQQRPSARRALRQNRVTIRVIDCRRGTTVLLRPRTDH